MVGRYKQGMVVMIVGWGGGGGGVGLDTVHLKQTFAIEEENVNTSIKC